MDITCIGPSGTKALSTMKTYLKHMLKAKTKAGMSPAGAPFSCLEDFLMQHGREWRPTPYPPKWKKGTPKLCFNNSVSLMCRRPDLTYCEGLALGYIPVVHAWCVTASGEVVDPTWCADAEGGFRPMLGTDYFGVAFKREYVLKRRKTMGDRFTLLEDWGSDECYRILRGLDEPSQYISEDFQ
jgi:hypothetical protein